jgi:hypothetical protein
MVLITTQGTAPGTKGTLKEWWDAMSLEDIPAIETH